RVAGRTKDFLRTGDGGWLSPGEAVDAVDPGRNSVIDFQVVQKPDRNLDILVVQRDDASAEADRAAVVETLDRIVNPPETPTIRRVDHIPLTPGGKLRTLVAER
ncbi:MAG: phenylacetate--CoA ligase family protein, partial [Gemmatimonadetes bacterium]|nr:phenylacetate--CoA ligase family protein [Gemmatimonadota bacterium]